MHKKVFSLDFIGPLASRQQFAQAYQTWYRRVHRLRLQKQRREFRERNRARINEARRKNRDRDSETHRIWYWANREAILRRRRRDYGPKRDFFCLRRRQDYEKHRAKRIASAVRKERVRLTRDLNFRLKHRLRGRIRLALRSQQNETSTKIRQVLGCTIPEARRHLERQFLPGMTWENHGTHGWHIDHIKPCASFDLSDPEQQKICFHFTNLQPLWAKDNLRKSDTF